MLFLLQMCELLVAGLPLKSDSVESQKVNDLLVRLAEVRLLTSSLRVCVWGGRV
jgi:hypothetical protein